MRYQNLGLIDYKEAWDLQEKLFDEILQAKLNKKEEIPENKLLFCQHPHVYTLGKSGDINNLLLSEEFLKAKQAVFYKINRGGDITYHGPGQIVGYPIINLDSINITIRVYIYLLEEAIINVLKDYDVIATRSKGETGVWIDIDNKAKARKIAAVGVRISRMVSMHGFAFNINTNLDYYNYIIPCGIPDKGVTSLQKELGREVNIKEVEDKLLKQFEELLKVEIRVQWFNGSMV
jgi:lipoyl(octanoyl) transferase